MNSFPQRGPDSYSSGLSANALRESRPPFLGPRSFAAEDQHHFYGRENELADLCSLAVTYPIVLLYAQSGAGKTSLLNAGLVPRLEGEEKCHIWPVVRVQLPPLAHEHRATSNIFSAATLSFLSASDQTRPENLKFLIEQRQKEQPSRLQVLIFDQFEELFTTHLDRWEDREPFLQELSEILKSQPTLRIVLAMREEYVPLLDRYAAQFPNRLKIRYPLERLRREAALQAINQPFKNVGYAFEVWDQTRTVADHLVDKLLDTRVQVPEYGKDKDGNLKVVYKNQQIRGEYIEPLQLQIVCQRLWLRLEKENQNREANRESKVTEISVRDLDRFGNVEVALKDYYNQAVEEAVAEYAELRAKDPELQKLREIKEGDLRWWCENLITRENRRGIQEKGQLLTNGIPNAAIELLEKRHLVRIEGRDWAYWYELSHDLFVTPILNAKEEWQLQHNAVKQLTQGYIDKMLLWRQHRFSKHRDENFFLNQIELEQLKTLLEDPLLDKLDFASANSTTGQILEYLRDYLSASEQWHQQSRPAVVERMLAAQAEILRHRLGYLLETSALLAQESRKRAPSIEADQILRSALSLLPRPITLLPHRKGVVSVAVAPDNAWLATGCRDKKVRLWPIDDICADELKLKAGDAIELAHGGNVWCLAFHPRRNILATACSNNQVRLWRLPKSNRPPHLLFTFHHEDEANSVAFSPKGSFLATSSDDFTATIWNLRTGLKHLTVRHKTAVLGVAFHPHKLYWATASTNGLLGIWSSTGQLIVLLKFLGPVNGVSFSPDGTYFVAATDEHAAYLYEFEETRQAYRDFVRSRKIKADTSSPPDSANFARSQTSEATAETTAPERIVIVEEECAMMADAVDRQPLLHDDLVYRATFSPDLQRPLLVTASEDQTARLWEIPEGREVGRMIHNWRVTDAAFDASGTVALTSSDDKSVRVWEGSSSRESTRLQHRGRVQIVTFSSQGNYLASASEDGSAQLWIQDGSRTRPQKLEHDGKVWWACFSPDESLLATACKDGVARIWRTQDGVCLHTLVHPMSLECNCVTFSPDGHLLASGGDDPMIRLWDTSTGQLLTEIEHVGPMERVIFSPDSRYLAGFSPTSKRGVGLWRIEPQGSQELRSKKIEVMEHEKVVKDIAFHPYKPWLATASLDHYAKVWDFAQGQKVWDLKHSRGIVALAFDPDGEQLATAGYNDRARVWSLETGQKILDLFHDASVVDVVFSQDGQYLATAGHDKVASIWETDTYQEVARIFHGEPIENVSFSPDGTKLASACWDGSVRVIPWSPNDLTKEFEERIKRSLTPTEWRRYLAPEPYPTS